MKRAAALLIALSAVGLTAAPAAAAVVHDLPRDYPYPTGAWSPYLAGALIGVLALLGLALANRPIGASSAYADAPGLLSRAVAPRWTLSLPYYKDEPPKVSWTLVLVIATVLGALLAAWSGGELNGRYLQDLWIARFGQESHAWRTIAALAGGIIMAYGARLADGCTSGHGISGTLQLAVSSWIALICFFIGGVVTAMLIYRL